jgi:hypothetical protein
MGLVEHCNFGTVSGLEAAKPQKAAGVTFRDQE